MTLPRPSVLCSDYLEQGWLLDECPECAADRASIWFRIQAVGRALHARATLVDAILLLQSLGYRKLKCNKPQKVWSYSVLEAIAGSPRFALPFIGLMVFVMASIQFAGTWIRSWNPYKFLSVTNDILTPWRIWVVSFSTGHPEISAALLALASGLVGASISRARQRQHSRRVESAEQELALGTRRAELACAWFIHPALCDSHQVPTINLVATILPLRNELPYLECLGTKECLSVRDQGGQLGEQGLRLRAQVRWLLLYGQYLNPAEIEDLHRNRSTPEYGAQI